MVIAEAKKLFIVIIGALLNAIGLNLFLIPADVYASGFTGVAQLLSSALDQYSPIYFSTGTLLFILNIPVGILGCMLEGDIERFDILAGKRRAHRFDCA